jgi:hypothetical protein
MTAGSGRPDLKLKRAGQFADQLRQAIDDYRFSDAFYVEQSADQHQGTIDFTLRVKTPPPLDEWSLLLGDCVHNLRAALDHLAWQLDSKPDSGTAFPIRLQAPNDWPPACVARMDPEAQVIIDAVQPHWEELAGRVPMRHPLAAIHALDIDDKHKVLIGTAEALAGDSIIGIPFEASIEHVLPAPFADASQMGRMRFPGGVVTPVEFRADFQVVLTEEPWVHADVMWMLEEVLMKWIPDVVINPLLPYARN